MIGGTDFRQLWIGASISKVGTQLSGVAIPVLAIESLHANESQMGILTACETLAFLVVGLPAGAWVDRWRKRRVLVVNDLLRAVLFASVPLAWWLGVLTLAQLFAVATAVGVCTVFFDVADQSYLPHLLTGEDMVRGNSRLAASESVAQVGGPAMAGGLLRIVSAPALIGLDALSFVASAAFVSRIRKPDTLVSRDDRRPLRAEIAEGLGFVVRHPLLRRIVACTSLGNFFGNMTFALFALFVLRDLGLSAGALGLIFSASAVGGLVGAVSSERITRLVGEGRTIALSALLMPVAAALTPLAIVVPPQWQFATLVAGGVPFFFLVVVYNITQVSYRQRVCPPALLGRMNASVRFIVWGSAPIGALAGGAIGTEFGVPVVLWVTVVGTALAALPVVLSPLMTMTTMPGDETAGD